MFSSLLFGTSSYGEEPAEMASLDSFKLKIEVIEQSLSADWIQINWCNSRHLVSYLTESMERIEAGETDVLYTASEYHSQLMNFAQLAAETAERNEHPGLSHHYIVQGLRAVQVSAALRKGEAPADIKARLNSDDNCHSGSTQ